MNIPDYRLDPPDEPTQFTDEQPLGDARVLVEWHFEFGAVVIDGGWVNGECVDADRFAGWQRDLWRSAIQRERDSERAAFEADQRELLT